MGIGAAGAGGNMVGGNTMGALACSCFDGCCRLRPLKDTVLLDVALEDDSIDLLCAATLD